MTVEGCTALLAVIFYIFWITLSRQGWKKRALAAEEKLGRKLRDIKIRGEE